MHWAISGKQNYFNSIFQIVSLFLLLNNTTKECLQPTLMLRDMRSQIRKRVRNIMPSWYKDRIPQFTISWYPPVRIIKLPKGLSVAASLLIAQLNCLVRCFMSNCCHNHQILDEAVMQQILSVFILNCKSMNLHSSMHMHESELLDMPLLIHRLGPTEGFPLTECNFLASPSHYKPQMLSP